MGEPEKEPAIGGQRHDLTTHRRVSADEGNTSGVKYNSTDRERDLHASGNALCNATASQNIGAGAGGDLDRFRSEPSARVVAAPATTSSKPLRLPTPPPPEGNVDFSPLLLWHAQEHANDQENEGQSGPADPTTAQRDRPFGVHTNLEQQSVWAKTDQHTWPRSEPRQQAESQQIAGIATLPAYSHAGSYMSAYGQNGGGASFHPSQLFSGRAIAQPQRYAEHAHDYAPDSMPHPIYYIPRHSSQSSALPHLNGCVQGLSAYGPPHGPLGSDQYGLTSPLRPVLVPPQIDSRMSQAEASLRQGSDRFQAPPFHYWPLTPTPSAPSSAVANQHTRTELDKRSRRKQDVYKQKGTARRQSNADRRPKPMRKYARKKQANSQAADGLAVTEANQSHAPIYYSTLPQAPMPQPAWPSEYVPMPQYQLSQDPMLPARATDHLITPATYDSEHIYQHIVTEYAMYKWPVKLYEINTIKTGCEYAQSWLEGSVFSNLDRKVYNRSFNHMTRGFIQNGNQLRFIVVNNASNPFELGNPPENTTSIGVYGAYWYYHREIQWTTFAPSLRYQINSAEFSGLIKEVHRWEFDMRASEKRFHRAYWLSANRGLLGGLLNTSQGQDEPLDLSEDDADDSFELSEDDLKGGDDCDMSHEQAEAAWYRILDDVSEEPQYSDHVDVWSSEW